MLAAVTRGLSIARGPETSLRHAIPEGLTVYAVGDVHGERALLEDLLLQIRRDAERLPAPASTAIVFLGDYVDRGPDSRGVLDLLLDGPLPGAEHRFLLGNHEQVMLDFLQDPERAAGWLDYGGITTAASYGVRLPVPREAATRAEFRDALDAAVPAAHKAFLARLEPLVVYGDYAFAHAGVHPDRSLAEQQVGDLLWIREAFLEWTGPLEKRIVHGHTIRPTPEIFPNRIALDTGAYASGVLSAAILCGDQVRLLQARR